MLPRALKKITKRTIDLGLEKITEIYFKDSSKQWNVRFEDVDGNPIYGETHEEYLEFVPMGDESVLVALDRDQHRAVVVDREGRHLFGGWHDQPILFEKFYDKNFYARARDLKVLESCYFSRDGVRFKWFNEVPLFDYHYDFINKLGLKGKYNKMFTQIDEKMPSSSFVPSQPYTSDDRLKVYTAICDRVSRLKKLYDGDALRTEVSQLMDYVLNYNKKNMANLAKKLK